MLCIDRGEMMHDPDGEPETVVRICPQKFGLKKEILRVMIIDVMILESEHCREQTMAVLCFYK